MAVATPEIDDPELDSRTKTRRQPPYAVVVFNDNDHTYQYVITTFQKVFNYSQRKSFDLADSIHKNGRAIVWTGAFEVAELKKEQIESAGPDQWASKKVTWPLKVELQPLP